MHRTLSYITHELHFTLITTFPTTLSVIISSYPDASVILSVIVTTIRMSEEVIMFVDVNCMHNNTMVVNLMNKIHIFVQINRICCFILSIKPHPPFPDLKLCQRDAYDTTLHHRKALPHHVLKRLAGVFPLL